MTKRLIYLMSVMAPLALLAISCGGGGSEPDPEPTPEPDKPSVPAKQDVALTSKPAGDTLTVQVKSTDAWTLEKDENYSWIKASPESGSAAGTIEVTFITTPNESGRERSATFFALQGKSTIYEIFITQAKMAVPMGEGDYAFLKAVVDGKLLGDATPEVTDWYSFDPSIMNGTGFNFVDKDGLWYIVSIDGAPLTGFPNEMNLQELEVIRLNNQTGLVGKMLPQTWSTPKLQIVSLSHTIMTGTIPQGMADSPILNQIYFDDTDFYGALPHVWATKSLEVALLGSTSNGTNKDDEIYLTDTECPYLGYMVPATLDVILNSQRVAQSDKTQMKLGGVREGFWVGFEEGWGQTRYELFDPAAVKGDGTVWSDWRLLIGKTENDPDVWAWYFSNMGYSDASMKTFIPKKMLKWDQAMADKFTAAAKAAHDAKTTIDMTQFGKDPEEKKDDSIAAGNLVTVGDSFWTAN